MRNEKRLIIVVKAITCKAAEGASPGRAWSDLVTCIISGSVWWEDEENVILPVKKI